MRDVTDQWQSVDSEGRQIYRVFLRDGEFDFPLLALYHPGLTYTADASGESTRDGRLLPVEKRGERLTRGEQRIQQFIEENRSAT